MRDRTKTNDGQAAPLAGAGFAAKVKDVRIPPLPAAAARLIEEINRPDPDMERLVQVISASPETAAKVIQTINSSIFSLRNPVISVRHAAALLGLRHLRPVALSFAMIGAVPRPPAELFHHESFWSDSLIRAMFARAFATRNCPGDKEVAFTGSLLADLALPVLLVAWQRPYAPVLKKWREGGHRLSDIERQVYGWDHGQAAAFILGTWGLPGELTSLVEKHAHAPEDLAKQGLTDGVLLPMSVAALAPSVMLGDEARGTRFVRAAMHYFEITPREMVDQVALIRSGFEEVCSVFEIKHTAAGALLDQLVVAASLEDEVG
jgi:HD-like signal output (HDOD) protein